MNKSQFMKAYLPVVISLIIMFKLESWELPLLLEAAIAGVISALLYGMVIYKRKSYVNEK